MTTYIKATTLHVTFAYISLLLSSSLPVEAKLMTNNEEITAAAL